MAVNELAFQDLMAGLLAQTPNSPTDPPVEAKVEAEAPHEDLVLEALGIKPVELPAAEASALSAVPKEAVVEALTSPSAVPSFEEKVARFRSLFGGGG